MLASLPYPRQKTIIIDKVTHHAILVGGASNIAKCQAGSARYPTGAGGVCSSATTWGSDDGLACRDFHTPID